MKLSSAALVAAVLVPAVPASQFVNLYNVSEPTNQGFIIELDPGSSLGKRDVHSEFHIRAREVANYSVRHEFKNAEYFYGLSVDAKDVWALITLPEVKNIWPNRLHDRPRPFGASAVTPGDEAFSLHNDLKRDDVSLPHITGNSDVNSALKLTSVDEVHKLNITGKGVKVAIVDSGIDYRHPALGGGFGPGFKVAGGYDLVGDNYSGTNAPVPDSDPLTVCLEGGHGSHVAGIIAARDPDGVGFGVIGVAPDAELHMYRVFGCVGSVTDEILMQALQMAAEDGVDVISMSLGYASIWETASPYDTLLTGIRNKGVGLVIAAGNDGERGLYFTSEPALGPSVIAVGSVSNTKFATVYNATDSTGETIEYARIFPVHDETPFNVFTTPNEETSCDATTWTNITQQFADKEHVIALISAASQCAWKVDRLSAQTGIKHILWAADDDEDFRLEAPGDQVGFDVARLRNAAAEKIRAGIVAQGSNYTLTFNGKSVHDAQQPTNGTVNFFSTFGPTMEMSMKPQLAAPGGNILNTWPMTNNTGYALISGTSMATPHAAGVYALIKQAHPDLTPEQIANRMQATSNPLVQFQTDGVLTSTSQQGSGLINALKAITYETAVSPTELNLRDSASPASQKITIENKSQSPRTYKLGHRGAASIDALPQLYSENLNNIWRWAANNNPVYASASFSSDSIEVPASSTATFEVTVTPSTEHDPAKLPVYGGYITITSDDEELVVPYAGVPYARSSIEVLDTTNLTTRASSPAPPAGVPELPYVRNSDTGRRINGITTFTFPSPGRGGIEDNPVFLGSIRQPCSYVRFDVVPADTAFEPTNYGYDTSIKDNTVSPPVNGLDDFAGVKSYGAFATIVGGHDKPVNPWQWYWRGYGTFGQEWQWATVALDNGTIYQLANADYRVLIRALRFDYDWKDPKGYDSWLSPVIQVNITDPGYPNPMLKPQ
ncbi:subtilisin-like protein [Hypomontagnella monticulosa]|nr:subtilisin-like protein [Hypomontagnella monticulosa]